MTKRSAKGYVLHRTDSTYKVYDLWPRDVKAIEDAWTQGKTCVRISIGLIGLSDLREMVEWIPPEEDETPDLQKPILPDMEPEAVEWINENWRRWMGGELDDD